MKKIVLLMALALAWSSDSLAVVKDSLLIKPIQISANEAGTISIEMNNEDAIWGLQFDLTLPSWMHIDIQEGVAPIALNPLRFPNTVTEQGMTFKHTMAYNLVSSNCLRVLVYSMDPNLFINGNIGEVMKISFLSDDNVEEGTYSLELSNIVLVIDGVTDVQPKVSSTDVSVCDYQLGDANGDGGVTVSDFTVIANYILGNQPTNFVEKAADVNVDGSITVSDLTGIANIILYGSTVGSF